MEHIELKQKMEAFIGQLEADGIKQMVEDMRALMSYYR